MKTITHQALEHIMAACPGTKIVKRDGKTIACIPSYDATNDIVSITEKEVISPVETPMGILPVFGVRTGPTFNPAGAAKISPLGQLYRIIGYSPPVKDDKD